MPSKNKIYGRWQDRYERSFKADDGEVSRNIRRKSALAERIEHHQAVGQIPPIVPLRGARLSSSHTAVDPMKKKLSAK